MGFLDSIFGGDKPTPKNIDKLVMRVKERYAQPEYRREAMDRLLAMGTTESLLAVMSRFAVVVQSPHWDEEEKRWLVDELAARGAPAKEAVAQFLGRADAIAFAAKALRSLTTADEYLHGLIEALRARPPVDHRSTHGKTELVAALAETGDARVVEALLPYLEDHADDVQCAVLDALQILWPKLGEGDRAAATARLQAMVADDTRSARVVRAAAGAIARLALPIDTSKPLSPAVTEDYVVKDGKLARRG
jgi:hypothetical protein